jgi:heme oxygenase
MPLFFILLSHLYTFEKSDTMLIEQIRASTGNEHQQLEATLLPYIDKISNKEDYSALLRAFYGYIHPVQEKIMLQIDKTLVPGIEDRRHAKLLLLDLEAMDDAGEPVLCQELPAINSHTSAMGALYVLEGSTLGGKIISKMIAGKLNGAASLQFFNGYGEKTGSMWKEFITQLQQNDHPDHNGIIVESVRKTFSLFDKWLKEKLDSND